MRGRMSLGSSGLLLWGGRLKNGGRLSRMSHSASNLFQPKYFATKIFLSENLLPSFFCCSRYHLWMRPGEGRMRGRMSPGSSSLLLRGSRLEDGGRMGRMSHSASNLFQLKYLAVILPRDLWMRPDEGPDEPRLIRPPAMGCCLKNGGRMSRMSHSVSNLFQLKPLVFIPILNLHLISILESKFHFHLGILHNCIQLKFNLKFEDEQKMKGHREEETQSERCFPT